jgi:hypothetical protein
MTKSGKIKINVSHKYIHYTVENRIFAVSSPSNTRQNQFMLL